MSHPYIANECAHNDHAACSGRCPYEDCRARCVCGCGHPGASAAVAPEPARAPRPPAGMAKRGVGVAEPARG